MFRTETFCCPTRKRSAPIPGRKKTKDSKLRKTKPLDLIAQDNESKDDNAEKKITSDLESADRFDTQNL